MGRIRIFLATCVGLSLIGGANQALAKRSARASTRLTVISPQQYSTVKGTISITGTSGSSIVNLAVYDSSRNKLSADASPRGGNFNLPFDTSKLLNGKNVVSVIGFTVPAGGSGGSQIVRDLTLIVQNKTSSPTPTPSPKPTATPIPTPLPTPNPTPIATPIPTPQPTPVQTPVPTPSSGAGVTAIGADVFLSSTGINVHIDQGYSAQSYVAPLSYLGVRAIRTGTSNIAGAVLVHKQTGVMVNVFSNGDLPGIMSAAKTLASNNALLSLEGPNEPNNFPLVYQGQQGGGQGTWVPVANYQRDLYSSVKGDSVLKNYPVLGVSEDAGEIDNVGLQFLTIPIGANTVLPAGTKFSDYANVHNYVSSTQNVYVDNMAWKCADPVLDDVWDGLYVEYGVTWYKRFAGYDNSQLQTLPRVTTETGMGSTSHGERAQGVLLVNNYLAQFKRGWRYTFIYQVRDNEGGGSDQGLYNEDFTPKLAATYIHNLTSILADSGTVATPSKLNYSIANQSATVHDMLLQKSSGAFELVVWGEQVSGSSSVTVNLGVKYSSVKVYDVTSGTTPVQSYSNADNIPLTLTDHAMIIEVTN